MRAYPQSHVGSVVDDHHGEQVPDPYRWLETTTDQETTRWIAAQNEVTEGFLAAVPARESIRAQVTAMSDYPKLTVPFERGGRWFQFRNPGLDAQPVLFLLDEPGGAARPLLDPNTLSADGTTAVQLSRRQQRRLAPGVRDQRRRLRLADLADPGCGDRTRPR